MTVIYFFFGHFIVFRVLFTLVGRKVSEKFVKTFRWKKVSDNKLFWKTVKPSLSEKFIARDRISLSENGEIVRTEIETGETFENFFGNIVKNLNRILIIL